MYKYIGIAQKNLENVGIKMDYETLKSMGVSNVINMLRNNGLPWRAGITKPSIERRVAKRRKKI